MIAMKPGPDKNACSGPQGLEAGVSTRKGEMADRVLGPAAPVRYLTPASSFKRCS